MAGSPIRITGQADLLVFIRASLVALTCRLAHDTGVMNSAAMPKRAGRFDSGSVVEIW